MEESRVFARIRINIEVPLKFLDLNSGKNGEAEIVDISANGIGFITKENLKPKTALDMLLFIPNDGKPVYVHGEVVWSCVLADKVRQRVGVHLENPDPVSFSMLLQKNF